MEVATRSRSSRAHARSALGATDSHTTADDLVANTPLARRDLSLNAAGGGLNLQGGTSTGRGERHMRLADRAIGRASP
jgi:hypothetical protein